MASRITRRAWALTTLALAESPELAEAWQHAHQAATSPNPPKFETLDPSFALEIQALVSHIIPSDGSPGATEAGVIYFIDRALGTWQPEYLESYRNGLAEVQRIRERMFPGSTSIALLRASDQIKLIESFEKTPFFELLRAHTAMGFLGSPVHGGNRNGVGWAHIGFEDKASFSPPFGYYDARALEEGGQ